MSRHLRYYCVNSGARVAQAIPAPISHKATQWSLAAIEPGETINASRFFVYLMLIDQLIDHADADRIRLSVDHCQRDLAGRNATAQYRSFFHRLYDF
jgi:hypothetical protein